MADRELSTGKVVPRNHKPKIHCRGKHGGAMCGVRLGLIKPTTEDVNCQRCLILLGDQSLAFRIGVKGFESGLK